MQKITPCLWFDSQAEEAVKFYTSLIKNSEVLNINYYDEASSKASGQPQGSVLTVKFTLDGHELLALNGGPQFKFSEAISLIINCDTQEEINTLWEKLSEGGEKQPCGWLKDKYGLSWQVVPASLDRLVNDPDPAKSHRVMAALMQMKKIDIKTLEDAYQGEEVMHK